MLPNLLLYNVVFSLRLLFFYRGTPLLQTEQPEENVYESVSDIFVCETAVLGADRFPSS